MTTHNCPTHSICKEILYIYIQKFCLERQIKYAFAQMVQIYDDHYANSILGKQYLSRRKKRAFDQFDPKKGCSTPASFHLFHFPIDETFIQRLIRSLKTDNLCSTNMQLLSFRPNARIVHYCRRLELWLKGLIINNPMLTFLD